DSRGGTKPPRGDFGPSGPRFGGIATVPAPGAGRPEAVARCPSADWGPLDDGGAKGDWAMNSVPPRLRWPRVGGAGSAFGAPYAGIGTVAPRSASEDGG